MSVEAKYKIINALGLHARAAAALVQEANRFESEVYLGRTDDDVVNGKSIMGVLTLAATQGTEILIRCEGPDETLALAAIGDLVKDGFGED